MYMTSCHQSMVTKRRGGVDAKVVTIQSRKPEAKHTQTKLAYE